MICPNCNTEIADGSAFCSVCGKSTVKEPVISPELIGKKYSFRSARGTYFSTDSALSLLKGWILTYVTFNEDSMICDSNVAKFVPLPEIRYDNIKNVGIEKKMPTYWILMCCMIIPIPFALLFGINTIVTIWTKDGKAMRFYTIRNDDAVALKNILDKIKAHYN